MLHAFLDDRPEMLHIQSPRYPYTSLAQRGFPDFGPAHLSPLVVSIAVQAIRHNIDMPSFASAIVKVQPLIVARINQKHRDRDWIVQRGPAGEPEHIGIGRGEENEQVVQHGPEVERSGFDLWMSRIFVLRGLVQ